MLQETSRIFEPAVVPAISCTEVDPATWTGDLLVIGVLASDVANSEGTGKSCIE